MAADYPGPERAPVQQREHNRFAGLKLRVKPEVPELSPLERSVVRVARSVADIMRVRTEGYGELPHQRAVLDKAVAEMEVLRPGVKRDLQNVFDADRTMIDEAADGRPQRAIWAMALEAEVRDPPRRADQFVARWDKLQKQSQRAYVTGDMTNHKAIRSEMASVDAPSDASGKSGYVGT